MCAETETFQTELGPLVASLQRYGAAEAAMRARALADLATELDTDTLLSLLTNINVVPLSSARPRRAAQRAPQHLLLGRRRLVG